MSADLPNDLLLYAFNNATKLLQVAFDEPEGSDKRLRYCSLAQQELGKLSAVNAEEYERVSQIQFLLGDIQLYRGEYGAALMKYESLIEKIHQPRILRDLHIKISSALIGLGEFKAARKNLRIAVEHYQDYFDDVKNRQMYSNLSRCLYELGEYKPAIEVGEKVIQMNRHYEGSYIYVALSYKALGLLTEAARTMQRAEVYETPWDEKNKAKVKALAAQFTKEAAV
eukprot:CAMPEP_0170065584 /NCGR_PEP_ID=MMETSP0019_2-20121128/5615_1 /TAXON_ID=98059 /ORGANISM="Dinobryon sp., Strain UTEXLB2267" /LENGTH=225 /DNA_ID=CAMNT_0010272487 /DNA_START=334 /DNA_END=1012 /DNA_ORIENTATION=+